MSRRILIVEDESVVAADIKSCLDESGFEVTGIAASAGDAVGEVSTKLPDLVLMDIRLQGDLDGIEAADLLHDRFGTGIVYLTAHGDRDTIERAKKTYPLGFLLKPFKPGELINMVEFALERARAERSERERHDAALHESEERVRRLVGILPAGVYACDAAGAITFCNDRAAQLWGRRPQTGDRFCGSLRLQLPDGRPLAHAESPMAAAIAEGRTFRDEPLIIERPDGSLVHTLVNIVPVTDAAGVVNGAINAFIDMTALKHAEEKLVEANRRLAFLEATLDLLVTISPSGAITDVNEAAIRVTGVEREKLIGTEFSEIFTEPEKARQGYQQAFSKGSVADYPLTIRGASGQHTNVLYNASVYKDVHGNVLGVFAAVRDVTAQKKAEAEIAEQRRKELERLAELEAFQRLTVGRELKMIELKKEIAELKQRVPK